MHICRNYAVGFFVGCFVSSNGEFITFTSEGYCAQHIPAGGNALGDKARPSIDVQAVAGAFRMRRMTWEAPAGCGGYPPGREAASCSLVLLCGFGRAIPGIGEGLSFPYRDRTGGVLCRAWGWLRNGGKRQIKWRAGQWWRARA